MGLEEEIKRLAIAPAAKKQAQSEVSRLKQNIDNLNQQLQQLQVTLNAAQLDRAAAEQRTELLKQQLELSRIGCGDVGVGEQRVVKAQSIWRGYKARKQLGQLKVEAAENKRKDEFCSGFLQKCAEHREYSIAAEVGGLLRDKQLQAAFDKASELITTMPQLNPSPPIPAYPDAPPSYQSQDCPATKP